MASVWKRFEEASLAFAPEGSSKRKLIQIIGIVVFFQGVSIAFLSSHFGPALGVLSMALGILILTLFPPKLKLERRAETHKVDEEQGATYGIRIIETVLRKIGGAYATIALGAAIIVGVVLYNLYLSSRPDIGDMDMLSIMLGGLLIVYPEASKRFKVEICFALMFIALVVVILVIPQAVLSFGDGDSAIGNWYVYYMLAAPFAGALNLMGIEASAHAEVVTITFNDGTIQMLGISTGCAGLYSFSIFVSAFASFVLVFERLPVKTTALVLGIGLLVAYLGNLFRMIMIGVIGYYRGIEALLWAHDNIGWMIFLGWSSVFWYALIRFADRRKGKSKTTEQSVDPSSQS